MSVDQTDFTTALLNPEQAVPTGLTNPDGAPATKRFDVYRNNVVSSLTDALRTGFPVLRKLLGEEFFDAMAGLYVRSYPPTSPLMMHFGQEMPSFLAGFPPVAHLPYLPDVARLELALREAYHAADATPADPSAMATMTPDRLVALRLTLAPSLRVVSSEFPVASIWRANTIAGTPKPVARPEDALITRPEFDPRVDLLPAGGALFIATLQAGETLGDAITAAEASAPEFDLTTHLQLLLQTSAIATISEGPK